MVLTTTIYLMIGFLAIKLFGPNIETNILLNIDGNVGFSSLFMRIVFLGVIICHVPYTFLCGKEGTCIVVDEFINKTMSKSL